MVCAEPWTGMRKNIGIKKKTRFKTIEECIYYYNSIQEPSQDINNCFKIIHISDIILVRNFYRGKFAWVCEYYEIDKEELDE